MAIQEDPPPAIPEWIVTYGDMMSLLLTFFIMLAGMSEIKKNEKFQGVADALEQQFGFDQTQEARIPGEYEARRTEYHEMTAAGRARKDRWRDAGNKRRASPGEMKQVSTVRPTDTPVPSAVIYFDELSTELTSEAKTQLASAMQQFLGKPQKLEIRGHTTYRPVDTARWSDHMELGYARARVVARYLEEELKVEPERLRVSSVGFHEPVTLSFEERISKKNARVEIIGLTEFVEEFRGSGAEGEPYWQGTAEP
jgi:chemotaxis protein MotB